MKMETARSVATRESSGENFAPLSTGNSVVECPFIERCGSRGRQGSQGPATWPRLYVVHTAKATRLNLLGLGPYQRTHDLCRKQERPLGASAKCAVKGHKAQIAACGKGAEVRICPVL